jgi:mannan endo-1,4-beta-mannosidase
MITRMSQFFSRFLAVAAAGLLLVAPDAMAQTAGLVSRSGRHLMLNGQPYYVHGTNQYALFYLDSSSVDELLRDAASLGANVVRSWAFCDGDHNDGVCFQPSPGVYDETTFQRLDYVIRRAGQLNLRLILTLTNNWDDFGGMNQYVAWSPTASSHDEFYTDAAARAMYRDYVQHVLNRVNSLTGIAYKDDPTILMWELANEPQCQSDTSGDTVLAWVEEMASFIKSIDPNHLVGTGEEGWYTTKGGDWRHDGTKGVDFLRNSQVADVDVTSFHMHPSLYLLSDAEALDWITEHAQDAHDVVGKPVSLGEFSWRAPREIFGDFSAGPETWRVDFGGFNSSPPVRVASPSVNDNGALAYQTNGKLQRQQEAAGERVFEDPGIDVRAYTQLTGWVMVPSSTPSGIRADLYAKSGPDWLWRDGTDLLLPPGAWTMVTLDVSNVAFPEQVRSVGIRITNGNSKYSGPVYFDLVTGRSTLGGETLADRDNHFGQWYDRLDADDVDAALFWALGTHLPDTTFLPDWDEFTVYTPEDAGTTTVIKDYALRIAEKNGLPPDGGVLSIGNIDVRLINKGGRRRQALADILVVDQYNHPVAGATVSTAWSGLAGDTDDTVTGANGVAENIVSDTVSVGSGTFTVTVNDLSKAGFVYDPSANAETSDQISF